MLQLVLTLLYMGLSFAAPPEKIVFLGDSITEGYGVAHEQAYPARVQDLAAKDGKNWMIVNSGVSGSTSASALARVRWVIKEKPAFVLLALGANDGLRGLKVAELTKNLSEAIELAKKEKVKIALVGMRMPPNYGERYTKEFAEAFPAVAKKENVPLLPFLLEGVAGRESLNQPDRIHPNEKGHEIVARTVYKFLLKELK